MTVARAHLVDPSVSRRYHWSPPMPLVTSSSPGMSSPPAVVTPAAARGAEQDREPIAPRFDLAPDRSAPQESRHRLSTPSGRNLRSMPESFATANNAFE
jgi:hypothetical protein